MTRFAWLVLDCDGVVRHWDEDQLDAMARRHGLDAGAVAQVAFGPELLDAAMCGRLSAEEWALEIAGRTGVAQVAEDFLAQGWSIDQRVLSIVDDVRRAGLVRVAVFSNASTRLEDDLASCRVAERFDEIVSSARLGLAKPDPAAFAACAARLGADPAQCLFVDDRAENVAGARAAGMSAELFMGPGALQALVEAAGLLGALRSA